MKKQTLDARPDIFHETIKLVLQALLLATFVTTFIVKPFFIPSGSMMPTLLVGDYVLVNKLAYGYSKYSLPFSPNLFSGRIFASAPKRGDIVVFRFPPNPDLDYVKRLIGLPGDHVQVRGGILFINGEPIPRETDGTANGTPVYRELLDSSVSYDTLDQIEGSRGDDTPEFVVPADHFFMMGDNRDNSADSRFEVGFVPAENLIGRVIGTVRLPTLR